MTVCIDQNIMMMRVLQNRNNQLVFFETIGTFVLCYGIACSSVQVGADFLFAASMFLSLALCG